MTNRSPARVRAIAVRPAGPGFPPLAERLDLEPGAASPWLQKGMSWRGADVPYARATTLCRHFTCSTLSRSTVRRTTVASARTVQQVTAAATAVAAPSGPPSVLPMQVSVDGSMLAIIDEGWREARVARLGVVSPDSSAPDAVRTTQLSYAAALGDAQTFQTVALPEVLHRGLEQAPQVAAVSDGATWIQDFVDDHCPHAVRILDVAHAAEYLAAAAQASFGPGTEASSEWFATQRHALRHDEPARVLAALAALPASEARDTALRSLGERRTTIAYPAFVAAGWPIGSGSVESAHKHVLQARMKGPGMRWELVTAQAMIALRVVLANGRWDELWPQLGAHQRQARRARSAARRQARPPAPPASRQPVAPRSPPAPRPAAPGRRKLVPHGRPTADHPWRRPLSFFATATATKK